MLPSERSPGCLHAAPAWTKWLLLVVAVSIAAGGFTMLTLMNTMGGVLGGMIVASFGMSIVYLQCWQMCCPCQGPNHYSLGEIYSSERAGLHQNPDVWRAGEPPDSIMFEHIDRSSV